MTAQAVLMKTRTDPAPIAVHLRSHVERHIGLTDILLSPGLHGHRREKHRLTRRVGRVFEAHRCSYGRFLVGLASLDPPYRLTEFTSPVYPAIRASDSRRASAQS